MQTNDTNNFTTKEILIQLDRKVDEGFKDLRDLISTGHSDHEARIRVLEKGDNRRSGAWALVFSLVSLIAASAAVAALFIH